MLSEHTLDLREDTMRVVSTHAWLQPPTLADMGLNPGEAIIRDHALPAGETSASFVIKVTPGKGQAFNVSAPPNKFWNRPPLVVFELLPQPPPGQKSERPAHYVQQTIADLFTRPKGKEKAPDGELPCDDDPEDK
jgi:hypothetical protein